MTIWGPVLAIHLSCVTARNDIQLALSPEAPSSAAASSEYNPYNAQCFEEEDRTRNDCDLDHETPTRNVLHALFERNNFTYHLEVRECEALNARHTTRRFASVTWLCTNTAGEQVEQRLPRTVLGMLPQFDTTLNPENDGDGQLCFTVNGGHDRFRFITAGGMVGIPELIAHHPEWLVPHTTESPRRVCMQLPICGLAGENTAQCRTYTR